MSKYQIGQKVNAISFTNCFGNVVPATLALTVEEVRLITPQGEFETLKPYYRIKAVASNGFGFIEGAELYFEAA